MRGSIVRSDRSSPGPSAEFVRGLAEQFDDLRPMPLVVTLIFGSEYPHVVAASLDRFCQERLGDSASRCLFAAVSVGVVCGLALADGRQLVVKAHHVGTTRRHLAAVQTAQRHLAASGVPAPEPVAGPAPLAKGLGTAETLLASGAWADPHASVTRVAMAGALARLAAAGRSLVGVVELGAGPMEMSPDALLPTPHDPRFDFAADSAGARWIDRLAEHARDVQRAGLTRDLVVGHTDWRVQNMRFDDRGQVCAVYDWDSLRVLPEPMLAGKQAANFTTDWSRELDRQYPTIEEALAFIAAFEAARGGPFDERQRRMARASLVHALAYIARCEHSDDATDFGRQAARRVARRTFPTDSARSLLQAHGESLLTG